MLGKKNSERNCEPKYFERNLGGKIFVGKIWWKILVKTATNCGLAGFYRGPKAHKEAQSNTIALLVFHRPRHLTPRLWTWHEKINILVMKS